MNGWRDFIGCVVGIVFGANENCNGLFARTRFPSDGHTPAERQKELRRCDGEVNCGRAALLRTPNIGAARQRPPYQPFTVNSPLEFTLQRVCPFHPQAEA
jgi:hypothetical protein